MAALENFRTNLRGLCQKRGVSQRQLATLAGVHYVTVNRVLQGILAPTVPLAEKLTKAAGGDMKKIFADPIDEH